MKNRIVRGVAGSFILISLLLAVYVNINWLWFTAFVGANLFQSSLTKWCLIGRHLKKIRHKRVIPPIRIFWKRGNANALPLSVSYLCQKY